jgi:hypothetical protein
LSHQEKLDRATREWKVSLVTFSAPPGKAYRKLPTFSFSPIHLFSLYCLIFYFPPLLPSITPPKYNPPPLRSPLDAGSCILESHIPLALAPSLVAPLTLSTAPTSFSTLDCKPQHTVILAHWSFSHLPFLPTCNIHSLILRPDPAKHDCLAGVPSEYCLALRCHKKQCGVVALDHNSHSSLWTRGISSRVDKHTFCRRLEPDRVRCTGPERQTFRQDNLLIVSLDRIP